MSQWVSGFAQIVREESDNIVKNHMLEYLAELMEDSHDFGWQSAKGSHAVLLCRMEDNKIQWQDTHKIDRLCRVHAQRMAPTPQNKRINVKGPLVCKFYQKGGCMQIGDHENNGQMYLYVCQHCYAQGKSYPHPGKDCKNRSKKRLGHCLNAVPNSGKNCKKFPDRVIYNSKIGSIPPQNWKATWHCFSNVSYADIVKGTINQAYGKNSVNCPLKVNSPVKAHKVQNIYSKVTNLDTRCQY